MWLSRVVALAIGAGSGAGIQYVLQFKADKAVVSGAALRHSISRDQVTGLGAASPREARTVANEETSARTEAEIDRFAAWPRFDVHELTETYSRKVQSLAISQLKLPVLVPGSNAIREYHLSQGDRNPLLRTRRGSLAQKVQGLDGNIVLPGGFRIHIMGWQAELAVEYEVPDLQKRFLTYDAYMSFPQSLVLQVLTSDSTLIGVDGLTHYQMHSIWGCSNPGRQPYSHILFREPFDVGERVQAWGYDIGLKTWVRMEDVNHWKPLKTDDLILNSEKGHKCEI